MPKRLPSLFLSRHYPYYIVAPDYRQNSTGIRTMHSLCHVLNEQGYEAYITAKTTSPFLRTPLLDDTVRERHRLAGRPGIAVYPEVVSGNPLGQDVVVRWLLNKPGHLGGDEKPAPTDIVFHWDAWVLTPDISSHRLALPIIDERIFNNDANPHNQARSGFCYYAHKYLTFGGKIDPWLSQNGVSLCHDIPRPPEEIADILRRSTVLYCYEPSAIVLEAFACGCPVVYVATHYLDQFEWSAHERTMMAVEDRLPDTPVPSYVATEYFKSWADRQHKETWKELSNFVRITQKAAKQNSKRRASPAATKAPEALVAGIALSGSYQRWLSSRRINALDDTILANAITSWRNLPDFHLLVRIGGADLAALADTLDSLSSQLYNRWHIDIITELPCPDGLDALPCVGWQQTARDNPKPIIDYLVATGQRDWIIELPPGAILDPLYLWRLANEINCYPYSVAFFVDDYTLDEDGICTQLRLKPGINIEHLRSMDLAGPICISRDSWITTEHSSTSKGSPWFSQLLNIADKFGWSSIRHIPDTLISYTGTFPSDTEACLLALYHHLSRTAPGSEILAATGKSWRIRYPLSSTPRVSIAVLSSDQPDLLIRCLESIAQHTRYPDFEIFLQLTAGETSDPFITEWIQQQNQTGLGLTIVDRQAGEDLSAQCNRAARLIPGEFVAILRDDAVIIQPEWLEELVRTGLQSNIAAVAPRLIRPGDARIRNVGQVLGLRGTLGSPYADEATLQDTGYLDYLQIARDVSLLPNACVLLRKAEFGAVGGIDEQLADSDLAWADLCLKLLAAGKRLLCQPLATVIDGDTPPLDIEADFNLHTRKKQAAAEAEKVFVKRWLDVFPCDPFWNPNLSLNSKQVIPEVDYLPEWRYIPRNAYRIFARPLTGAQATYRITSPLQALANTGRVARCVWPMGSNRDELSPAELTRLSADTVIVQSYIYDHHLVALEKWRKLPNRPFTVYALDDLITRMDQNYHFRKNFPANSTSRLKFALDRCDRLVVSTDFLANIYGGFCKDIRVVPNRLESNLWLPLVSRKRTGKKTRIGWAGGDGHFNDLLLLREVIELTSLEADWVFFGMCPDELRPLISEFHGKVELAAYPEKLASLNLDIAVAPLSQTPFNQAKSNLRLLEYGILGIPVVCTDITPYQNSPAQCVPNTTDAWVKALRERIHDPDAREQEGTILRKWVRERFLLENHLDEWLAAHQE